MIMMLIEFFNVDSGKKNCSKTGYIIFRRREHSDRFRLSIGGAPQRHAERRAAARVRQTMLLIRPGLPPGCALAIRAFLLESECVPRARNDYATVRVTS
ncbi:hypothetical protein EVAR_59707_1 [Eumeta japonica]|uniref:Uncharacterized protein n=1 Tax=Eumeta variegata TaxID=151549 RepID=A0A4C1XIA6_EUMVA|nr:hypothetical protein EVAR_59707_1 [Eumeta japonica]